MLTIRWQFSAFRLVLRNLILVLEALILMMLLLGCEHFQLHLLVDPITARTPSKSSLKHCSRGNPYPPSLSLLMRSAVGVNWTNGSPVRPSDGIHEAPSDHSLAQTLELGLLPGR